MCVHVCVNVIVCCVCVMSLNLFLMSIKNTHLLLLSCVGGVLLHFSFAGTETNTPPKSICCWFWWWWWWCHCVIVNFVFFLFFILFSVSSIGLGGVAYVTVFNSSATWAATFRLSGVQVHAGYFHVSIIHNTLTWTTRSLTCVHGLPYACLLYTGGLDTPTVNQHNLFDSEKLKVFLVLLTGFKPLTFGSPVQCFNQWANPSPQLGVLFFSFHSAFLLGGVAYVTIFNSSATWATTFHLRGYKCMLVIFVFP